MMKAEFVKSVLNSFAYLVLGLISLFIILFIYSVEVKQVDIEWRPNLTAALQEAKITRKPVLAYFYSTHCYYCQKFKAETLENNSVILLANQRFIPVRVRMKTGLEEFAKYNINGIPTVITFAANQSIIGRVEGFQSPNEFVKSLWVMEAAHSGAAVSSLAKINQNLNSLSQQVCTKDGCSQPASFDLKMEQRSIVPENSLVADLVNMRDKLFQWDNLMQNQNIGVTLLIFVFLGFLVSLTPCTLAFLLLVSSYLLNTVKHGSLSARITLPLIFTFALALSYAVFGLLSVSMGLYLPSVVGNSFVVALFGSIFILISLYTLGMFHLKAPAFVMHKLVRINKFKSHYTYFEVAMMAVIMTVIAAPCVAAPLIGALVYVQQTGNMITGSALLFSFGIGICIPLLLASVLGAKYVPHAATWGQELKTFFGLTLMGMAVWFIGAIIPFPAYCMVIGSYLFIIGYVMLERYWENFSVPISTFFFLLLPFGVYIITLGIRVL